jgi:hypothetical protein
MMNLKMIVDFLESHHLGNPQKGIPYFLGGKTLSGSQILGQRMSLKMEPMILTVPKKRVKSTTVEPLHVESLLVDAATFRLWRCCNCCNKNAWICWIHPVLGNPRTTWNFGNNTGKIMGKSPNQMKVSLGKSSTTEGFSSQPCLITRG